MKVILHGTEIARTNHDHNHIQVDAEDRDGNTLSLFFDSTQDLSSMAKEMMGLVEAVQQKGMRLAKHQPCGCVICTCEDDYQCQGCGARNCGKHLAGEIPTPVYEAPEVSHE